MNSVTICKTYNGYMLTTDTESRGFPTLTDLFEVLQARWASLDAHLPRGFVDKMDGFALSRTTPAKVELPPNETFQNSFEGQE